MPDLTNAARSQILDCVKTAPGIHLRSVERETQLPLGQVLYHLDRLERMGMVVSARDAGFRRFYTANSVGRGEKRYLAALRHRVPRRILLALLSGPSRTHKQLQDALNVAGSTLSFHLQRMLAAGVLTRDPAGGTHTYRITDPAVVEHDLVAYRDSFHDEQVDAYVAGLAAAPDIPDM